MRQATRRLISGPLIRRPRRLFTEKAERGNLRGQPPAVVFPAWFDLAFAGTRRKEPHPRLRSDADRCRRYRATLGALDMAAEFADHAPEPRRVVHLDEMRHLMCSEIIQHKGRREDQPPGNDSDPAEVHEPQRLDWSRIDSRLTRTPSSGVVQRALCRSRRASRLRKSWTRRSIWSARRRRTVFFRRCRAFRSTPCRARLRDARSGAACRAAEPPCRLERRSLRQRPSRAAIQPP